MKNAAQTRILAIALAIATLAACVLALINLERENSFEVPTDGVSWVEASGGLRANHVPSGSPGDRAGIRVGDILVGINERPVTRMAPICAWCSLRPPEPLRPALNTAFSPPTSSFMRSDRLSYAATMSRW